MARTFLLTWNPNLWPDLDYEDVLHKIERKGRYKIKWSCGKSKQIHKGDRIFMVRLGVGVTPKGIFASGKVISEEPEEGTHWKYKNKVCNYVDIQLEQIIDPEKEDNSILNMEMLKERVSDKLRIWNPQQSGTEIPNNIALILEHVWKEFRPIGQTLPDDAARDIEGYRAEENAGTEGGKKKRLVNYYERKPALRMKAIEHYGTVCKVCGFDFMATYGERGKGYIDVHHLVPISRLKKETKVNPITDMTVLCANCHRMIHRNKDDVLSVDELKRIWEERIKN